MQTILDRRYLTLMSLYGRATWIFLILNFMALVPVGPTSEAVGLLLIILILGAYGYTTRL